MKLLLVLLISPLLTFAQFKSDSTWYDTKGDTLNVHGGGALYDHGTYYWFGEKRGKGASLGVTVYSSKNLYNWKYEGLALAAVDSAGSDIESGCLMERPKVIYNKKTKQYVMWFHLELKGKGYAAARAGVAVSNKITGPYKYLHSFRPNGNMSRDMNLFVDDDGAAYHIYSSHENWDLRIARLSDDYLTPTTKDSMLFSKQREAPVLFKHHHKYYLITSGCTGWAPNKATIHEADHPFGPWTLVGNPMTGKNADITFYGQSAFVLPVHGKKDAFIYVGDKWDPKNLRNSRYQWLPVLFKNGKVEIAWMEEWDLSVFK